MGCEQRPRPLPPILFINDSASATGPSLGYMSSLRASHATSSIPKATIRFVMLCLKKGVRQPSTSVEPTAVNVGVTHGKGASSTTFLECERQQLMDRLLATEGLQRMAKACER